MTTQPSQLNPFYPIQTIGFFGTGAGELEQPLWGMWRAQLEPFPTPAELVVCLPSGEQESLAAYVRQMAGTPADLDHELEAAGIEHLLQNDQTEEQ